MSQRNRKIFGAAVMLIFVCVYALVAMALAQGRVQELPKLGQTVVYILLGLIWVLPLMPLIKWMERPDLMRPDLQGPDLKRPELAKSQNKPIS